MNRTIAVLRVHMLDHGEAAWPWLVLASSLVLNAALWIVLGGHSGYAKTTGGIASLYVTAGIVAAIVVYQKLPLVAGMGVTRRTFLRGSLAYGLAFAVASSIVLMMLNRIEAATGGFGLGGSFFRVAWWTEVPTISLFIVYLVPMMLAITLGAALGGIALRFGKAGMFVTFVAIALVAAGLVLLAGALNAWPSLRSWISGLTPMALMLWLLAASAIVATASSFTLRRVPL
jgi:hypothetical protein